MLGGLIRRGLKKGVVGGSRAWLAIAVLAAVVKLVGRLVRREEVLVMREELPEGASLLISNGPSAPKAVRLGN